MGQMTGSSQGISKPATCLDYLVTAGIPQLCAKQSLHHAPAACLSPLPAPTAGDGEGQNEMNASMGYLRQYLNAWRDNAGSVRVFFPDNIVSSRQAGGDGAVQRIPLHAISSSICMVRVQPAADSLQASQRQGQPLTEHNASCLLTDTAS